MFRRFLSYFVHHRAERYGTIALLIVVIVIMALALVLPRLYEPAPAFELEWIVAETVRHEGRITQQDLDPYGNKEATKVHSLFNFDPNLLSDSGYAALGFTPKEIGTLRKYMAAGASFRQKDDFGRLFFMDATRFDSIRPYLLLPEKAEPKKPKYIKEPRDTSKWSDTVNVNRFQYNAILADLNTSDTTELKKLPGIGSFYARKIVEYRQQLGGYHDVGQLLELWRMTPESIDRFADRLSIDLNQIVQIKINKASTQKLSAHPYIPFVLANKIVNHRESNGPFRDINHMVDAGLFDDELRLKLAPYLNFE